MKLCGTYDSLVMSPDAPFAPKWLHMMPLSMSFSLPCATSPISFQFPCVQWPCAQATFQNTRCTPRLQEAPWLMSAFALSPGRSLQPPASPTHWEDRRFRQQKATRFLTSLPQDLFFDKCLHDLISTKCLHDLLFNKYPPDLSQVSTGPGFWQVSKTLSFTSAYTTFSFTSIRQTFSYKYLQDLVFDKYPQGLLLDKYLQDLVFWRVSTRPSFRQVSSKTYSLPSIQGRKFPAFSFRVWRFFRFDFVHRGWRVSLHQSSIALTKLTTAPQL